MRVSDIYIELVQSNVDIALAEEELESSQGIEKMIESLYEVLEEVDVAIEEEKGVPKGGSQNKQHRRILKKYRNKCAKDLLSHKQKYEEAREIFDRRNSFSKTDTDATFMCMKQGLTREQVGAKIEIDPRYLTNIENKRATSKYKGSL